MSGFCRFLSGGEPGSIQPLVTAMSDGLSDNARRSSFIQKFWFEKSEFCSSSITKHLVNVLAWQMTDNNSNSNSNTEKSERLIILSLSSDLQRGRIDQENKCVDFLIKEGAVQ